MKAIFASGHEVMVQTIMTPTGKDLYSVGAYFGRNGYVSPDFCWHKLRQYPPSFGVGSLVKSAHQPEVRELAIRFMKGMGYRGIGYVEFKRDQRDGAFKMVEMNARTGQTNALQAAAGIPLVLFQYCDLIGHPLPEVATTPTEWSGGSASTISTRSGDFIGEERSIRSNGSSPLPRSTYTPTMH